MSSAKKGGASAQKNALSSKNMHGIGSNGSNVPQAFARGSSGNPSNLISGQKDSRGLGSAGGMGVDSDSA